MRRPQAIQKTVRKPPSANARKCWRSRLTFYPYRNQLIVVYLPCYGDDRHRELLPCRPNPSARPSLRQAIYSRVSTDHQTTENQERELRAIADRMSWTVVKVYQDQGVSGAKSKENRPAFDALCKDASRRQFDLIAAWSVDRLGRSLQDLVGFLTEVHALGIKTPTS